MLLAFRSMENHSSRRMCLGMPIEGHGHGTQSVSKTTEWPVPYGGTWGMRGWGRRAPTTTAASVSIRVVAKRADGHRTWCALQAALLESKTSVNDISMPPFWHGLE